MKRPTLLGDGEVEATARVSVPRRARVETVIQLASEDASLAGQVLDSAGRPADDVLVSYRPHTPNIRWEGWFIPGDDLVTTDTSGHFLFDGLARGQRYTVYAYAISGEAASLADVAVGRNDLALRLAAAASLRVRLRGSGEKAPDGFWSARILEGEDTVASGDGRAGEPVQFDGLTPGACVVVVACSQVPSLSLRQADAEDVPLGVIDVPRISASRRARLSDPQSPARARHARALAPPAQGIT